MKQTDKIKKNESKDNIIYVDSSEETKKTNDRRIETTRNQRKALYFLLAILVVALIVFVVNLLTKEYKGYRVVRSNETNYENTASYVEFCGNLLKYTPDGVSYIDGNGNTVWSAGINMKVPVAVVSGKYVAIADLNGNTVGVFNDEGQVSNVTMPYKICDVDVASQGAFAVVLESEQTNYINLYNKKGEIVYEIQTTIDKSGYPLDISISDDGEKLFTSYLNVDNNNVGNSLAAYNFGDVGQNSNADRMVGGYSFAGEVVPKVEFIDNDTVVAFGTRTITVYSMKEKPSEKAKITFEEDIRSIFYGEDYIGVIQNDTSEKSGASYKMKVYNHNGKLEFEEYIDFEYSNVYAAKKEIIITGGPRCIIYRLNGSVKFNGNLSGNIMSVVPNGNNLEYVAVYDNLTEIIKLKLGKTDASVVTDVEGE